VVRDLVGSSVISWEISEKRRDQSPVQDNYQTAPRLRFDGITTVNSFPVLGIHTIVYG